MQTYKNRGLFLFLAFVAVATVNAQDSNYTAIEAEPHIVKILLDDKFKCSGSIIHPSWVVTTAYCIWSKGSQPERFKVKCGTDVRAEAFGDMHEVEKIIRPSNFNPTTLDNDVAMLKLKTDVLLSSKSQPIPLCTKAVPNGAMVRVTGWSDGYWSRISQKLRTEFLQKIPRSQCRAMYNLVGHEVTASMMCTAIPDENRCYGDAGSPMVYENELCGMVSWRSGCAIKEEPNVFTDIYVVKPFIERVMLNN